MRSITWASFNQPDGITGGPSSSDFYYDENHQRFEQIASYSGSIESTEYIGGLMEKMTNGSGTAYRYYVPAGNNFIVYNRWLNGTNAIDYATRDNIDSTAVITDASGALIVSEKFAALGWNENTAAQKATMASITRHEFTGQEGLDNYGLYYVDMNGRVYNPNGAVFLSPDPYIQDPANTQNYDRYNYVLNNPMPYVDPSGFMCMQTGYYIFSSSSVTLPGNVVLTSYGSTYVSTGEDCFQSFLNPVINLFGGSAHGGSATKPPTPTSVTQKNSAKNSSQKLCVGVARSLGNSGSLIGVQGGIPGRTEQRGTANVDPMQFGFQNGGAIAPYAANISGEIGTLSFSGVNDVIGGKSPIPGVNVRAALEELNVGLLIIEVNDAEDQGIAVATLTVPSGVSCPTGTSETATF